MIQKEVGDSVKFYRRGWDLCFDKILIETDEKRKGNPGRQNGWRR